MDHAEEQEWIDGEIELRRETATRIATVSIALLILVGALASVLTWSGQLHDQACATLDASTSSKTYQRCQKDRTLKSDVFAGSASAMTPAVLTIALAGSALLIAGTLLALTALVLNTSPALFTTLTWLGTGLVAFGVVAGTWLLIRAITASWALASFLRAVT